MNTIVRDFPGGSDSKASAYNAGDPVSIPGWGRSPGEGNGNPLQYSCLENPRDGGSWQATVQRVAKSQTRLHFHFHFLPSLVLPPPSLLFISSPILCAFSSEQQKVSPSYPKRILGLATCFLSKLLMSSVQFSSVTQSCLTLCDPMNRSTPGLSVHHQLPEFTQTHIH